MQSKQSSQKTKICKRCFKDFTNEATFQNLLNKDVSLCHNCLVELSPVLNKFKIGEIDALNLYWYTDRIQGLLYQFKACKDIELRDTFFEYYYHWLNYKFNGYTIIPAPSSIENNEERGFNQVVEMCSKLKLPMMCIIHKTTNVQQHNLSSKERQEIKGQMVIDDIDLSKKKILIVDDVYTTGSTVKSMIDLIKNKNPRRIKVLVMAKTIDLDLR